MSVRENIGYAGKARVDEFLERFRIQDLANARPAELSGASASGSHSHERSRATQACSSSMSRSQHSTRTRR